MMYKINATMAITITYTNICLKKLLNNIASSIFSHLNSQTSELVRSPYQKESFVTLFIMLKNVLIIDINDRIADNINPFIAPFFNLLF